MLSQTRLGLDLYCKSQLDIMQRSAAYMAELFTNILKQRIHFSVRAIRFNCDGASEFWSSTKHIHWRINKLPQELVLCNSLL